jgi:hypothetical protein
MDPVFLYAHLDILLNGTIGDSTSSHTVSTRVQTNVQSYQREWKDWLGCKYSTNADQQAGTHLMHPMKFRNMINVELCTT